jgi:hypothetical protein
LTKPKFLFNMKFPLLFRSIRPECCEQPRDTCVQYFRVLRFTQTRLQFENDKADMGRRDIGVLRGLGGNGDFRTLHDAFPSRSVLVTVGGDLSHFSRSFDG